MADAVGPLDELVEQWIQELDRKGRRRAATMQKAWRLLKPEVERASRSKDGMLTLDNRALERICRRIDRKDNPRAQRWLEKTTLNLLLFRLRRARRLQSAYLNVPRQVPRHFAVPLERISPAELRHAQQLRCYLARRGPLPPPPGWKWSAAVWYFCEFVTSAVLNGILVPGLVQKLLDCQGHDLVPRGWISLPQHTPRPSGDGRRRVGIRFPLNPPISRYLQQLRDALRNLGRATLHSRDPWVFPEAWRSPTWSSQTFAPAWRMFLQTAGLEPKSASSRRLLAHLARCGALLAVLDGLPPFLVSVATGEITVSPMTLPSFRRNFIGQDDGRRSRHGAALPRPPRTGRRRRPRDSGSISLFDEVETVRLQLRRESRMGDRRVLAARIRAIIGSRPFSPPAADPATVFDFNSRCYGAWVAALLEGRDRPGTVATRCSALATAFPSHFGDRPITQWTGQDWESTMSAVLEDHETSSVKAAFKRFGAFLWEEDLAEPVTIDWRAPALSKVPVPKLVPLVGFEDFERTFSACQELPAEPPLRRLLQVMAILGFFAGLRSSEATHLELRHFLLDPEPLLEVRVSKTREGLRNLYLARLMPEPYLSILVTFYLQRLQETGGDPYAPFLATPAHPQHYDSSTLSSFVGLALRQAVGESLCFHHLRHAFASWFLLRWVVAIGAVTPDPAKHPWARAAVFQHPALDGLRSLLFGLHAPRPGQAEFSHGLVVLCRLLGHGSPATTLSAYCHTVDVVTSLLRSQRPKL